MSDVIDRAIAAAAANADEPRGVEETLATIVDTAKVSLPGFEHIGVSTVDADGNPSTRSASSGLVLELDDLQYGLWEGPCVDTLEGAPVVEAPHIQQDPRWPRFVAAATPLGLRSQLAVHLYLDDQGTVGRTEHLLHDQRRRRPRGGRASGPARHLRSRGARQGHDQRESHRDAGCARSDQPGRPAGDGAVRHRARPGSGRTGPWICKLTTNRPLRGCDHRAQVERVVVGPLPQGVPLGSASPRK